MKGKIFFTTIKNFFLKKCPKTLTKTYIEVERFLLSLNRGGEMINHQKIHKKKYIKIFENSQ